MNMNQSNAVSEFRFGDIALTETLMVNGVPHITRKAIGEWLEYTDPQKAVDKLIERNSYIQSHSIPVKLTATDGKNYETDVYHPIGFLLIVMESAQPKALAMKQAVAEFVWHFAGPRQISRKEEMELIKMQRTLANDLGKTKDSFVRELLLERLGRICLDLGQAMPAISSLGKDANQLALQGV